jgi:hypothetical protein
MMTRAEAIDLFNSDDLVGLGMAADQVRRILQLLRVLPPAGP